MGNSGNNLLIGFFIFSVLFFSVALLVRHGTAVNSDVDAADRLASTSASSTARGDPLPLASRQLRLVSTAWTPFTDELGQPRFALDLVGEALRRVGIIAETVIVDEAKFTSSLLSGEFDGSAAVWKYTEREPVLMYSQPYLWNRLILVGRQGSDVSATSLADLAGKRIALIAGYVYDKEGETTDGLIVVGSNGEEDSVAKLLNGEVDYTLMDDLVVQYIISNYGEEARTRLAFGSTPLLTRALHLAVRRSLPDAEPIISRFNAELRGMIADRTYHRLLHLDWVEADVDGDGRREHVPYNDQAGLRQPERSYMLSATGSPTTRPGTTQRFYFDGTTWVLAGQVANDSAYLGYALTTNVGARWIRRHLDGSPASSELLSFITVYAGLGTDR